MESTPTRGIKAPHDRDVESIAQLCRQVRHELLAAYCRHESNSCLKLSSEAYSGSIQHKLKTFYADRLVYYDRASFGPCPDLRVDLNHAAREACRYSHPNLGIAMDSEKRVAVYFSRPMCPRWLPQQKSRLSPYRRNDETRLCRPPQVPYPNMHPIQLYSILPRRAP